MRHLIVFALLSAPAALFAQSTATVSPGMNQAQVVGVLGEPVNARSANEYTYLFYQNACGRKCGMNDLVVLRRDSVVDAIFRSPNRHYTGTSSSPAEVAPVLGGKHTEPLAVPKPATATKPAPGATTPAATTAAQPAPTSQSAPAESTTATPAATEPAPVQTRGTKTTVEVPGTKSEVVVPGTKTDVVVPGAKLTPGEANDTRPSIPLTPPILTPAPSDTSKKTPTS